MKITLKNITNNTKLVIIFVICILMLILGVCRIINSIFITIPDESYTAQQVAEKLSSADKVLVKKKFSLRTTYVIYANDEPIAIVKGKTVPIPGDTLCLTTFDGDVLGIATHKVFNFTATADCKTKNEEFTFKKSWIPFLGASLKRSGYDSRYTYGIFTKYITSDDSNDFKTKKHLFMHATTITKESLETSYSTEAAILIVCFDDMISVFESNNNNNSNNSSK